MVNSPYSLFKIILSCQKMNLPKYIPRPTLTLLIDFSPFDFKTNVWKKVHMSPRMQPGVLEEFRVQSS